LTPSSTSSSGTTTTTSWVPSNYRGDATTITAEIGTALYAGAKAASTSVKTIPGAPSKVSFYFTAAGSSTYGTDYLTNSTVVSSVTYARSANELSLSLSDQFGNAVGLSNSIKNITVAASGGSFDVNGVLQSSIACGNSTGQIPTAATCRSGAALQFPLTVNGVGPKVNFTQSAIYGAVGALAATITVYNSATTYTGTSGSMITSTFSSTLSAPSVNASIAAGGSATVSETLGTAQQGVPITLNLCATCTGTSPGYDSKFSDGSQSVTLYSSSTGTVSATIPVNVTVGSLARFNATATRPLTQLSTNTIASPFSSQVITLVGAINTLVINVAANSGASPGPNIAKAINGSTAYVDVAYADAYGNLIPIGSAPHNQIQIALSASNGGLLSATNVYIASGQVSTNGTGSIGSIQLTLPKTIGTAVVITGTGVVSGKTVSGTSSVTTVSAAPSMNVTSPIPLSGKLYANTTLVTFKGIANASAGSLSTNIASIGYKVGSAGWQSVATPALHNVAWSIPVVLAVGLNTVTFNVTDSESPSVTTVGTPFTVLVDTAAPTFGTITVANNTNVANVNVTSAGGDLNATSAQAWTNGTLVPSSSVTVTGTNNPGSSVTYQVTVSGLATGTSSLKVAARTLAGSLGSTTATVKVTAVTSTTAFTFPSTASSCTLGTYNAVCVSVMNTQSAAITGVVFAVVHNAAGQTVQVATSTVSSLAAGSSTTAYVVLSVPAGTYTVNVFVWSSTGASISTEQSSVSITVA